LQLAGRQLCVLHSRCLRLLPWHSLAGQLWCMREILNNDHGLSAMSLLLLLWWLLVLHGLAGCHWCALLLCSITLLLLLLQLQRDKISRVLPRSPWLLLDLLAIAVVLLLLWWRRALVGHLLLLLLLLGLRLLLRLGLRCDLHCSCQLVEFSKHAGTASCWKHHLLTNDTTRTAS
jgi:hypothetical protein